MSEPKTAAHHNMGLTGEVKTYFMQNGSTDWPQQAQIGTQQGLGGFPIGMMIPMAPDNWRKLSRDTQIKMLDELGILNP